MGLAWGLQMFGSQTINHATTAAQAGNRGAIGTLGANGREGDSPRIENLDTGILNWLSFTNQCNQVRIEPVRKLVRNETTTSPQSSFVIICLRPC